MITTIQNCIFRMSWSRGLGTVIRALDMTHNNILKLLNSIFEDNVSEMHGGLFYFKESQLNITSVGNIYRNNRAKGSGGIGYILHSNIWYWEHYANYIRIIN